MSTFALRFSAASAFGMATLLAALAPCLVAQGTLSVFATDFTGGAPAEFSGHSATESVLGYTGLGPLGNRFGGNFLRNDTGSPGVPQTHTVLTLTGLPIHTSVDVRFLLALIDTWDGSFSAPGAPVPDEFHVKVDGVTVFAETLSNFNNQQNQSYSPPPGVLLTPLPYLDRGWQVRNDFGETAYDMGAEPRLQAIPHTAPTLVVEWFAAGSGWQGGMDESWAIDNVAIVLHGVTQAACGLRNGSNLNPVECHCLSLPVLGANWNIDTDAGPNTLLTFVMVAFNPAPIPMPLLGGEVLIDTNAISLPGYGVHNFAVPNSQVWIGLRLFLQGFRYDATGPTMHIALLNAIDATLGI